MAPKRNSRRESQDASQSESFIRRQARAVWPVMIVVVPALAGVVAWISGVLPLADRITAKIKGPPPIVDIATARASTVSIGQSTLSFDPGEKDHVGPAGLSYMVPRPIGKIGRPPS